jgi:hypothetical protein
MPKIFFTEIDIEDLARRGVKEIPINDDTVLTDVARERAAKLGLALRSAQSSSSAARIASASPAPTEVGLDKEPLVTQVKADVIAKLGSKVDSALIEKIVRRVVAQLG